MALTSSTTPYFALLSLLVACVPGLCWLCKKIARSMKGRNNRRDQRQARDILPINLQQLPPSFSCEEYPAHPFNQPHHMVNNESRQLSNTTRGAPDHFRLAPDLESHAVWVDATVISSRTQGLVSLRTEQSSFHSSTWSVSPHERIS